MSATLAIKVDVDTERGTRLGVPALLRLFDELDIHATFLFSLGPDNTGRAIKRIFRPGFFQKAARTNVVGGGQKRLGLSLKGDSAAGCALARSHKNFTPGRPILHTTVDSVLFCKFVAWNRAGANGRTWVDEASSGANRGVVELS